MESFGSKITEETGAEWTVMRLRAPRWGVDVEVVTLRRLAEGPMDDREEGAAGPSDLRVDHIPTSPSVEAVRMRFAGA